MHPFPTVAVSCSLSEHTCCQDLTRHWSKLPGSVQYFVRQFVLGMETTTNLNDTPPDIHLPRMIHSLPLSVMICSLGPCREGRLQSVCFHSGYCISQWWPSLIIKKLLSVCSVCHKHWEFLPTYGYGCCFHLGPYTRPLWPWQGHLCDYMLSLKNPNPALLSFQSLLKTKDVLWKETH